MINSSARSYTIIDNWLLELAAKLFDDDKKLPQDELRHYEEVAIREKQMMALKSYLEGDEILESKHNHRIVKSSSYFEGNIELQESVSNQKTIALLQLLDLLVINDKLIYDSNMSYVWNTSEALKPITPILLPVKLSKNLQNKLLLASKFYYSVDNPNIIREGALYYLQLADFLGLYYWPSPKRAEFLREHIHAKAGFGFAGFAWELDKYLNKNLKEIAEEVFAPLQNANSNFDFPGFGSAILANCDSRKSIFSTALQFRETKECKEFRIWLREMDEALQTGNVRNISNNMKQIQDILEDVRQKLGIKNSDESRKIELQIGLSPTLKVDLEESLSSIFKHFKPKPFHIIFLRNHFSRVLNHSNIQNQINRLFVN